MQAEEEFARDRIEDIADAVGLDDKTAAFAWQVYKQAIDAGFQRVRDGRVFPAAVYAACRIRNKAIRPREIAEHADVDVDDIVSDFKRLIDTLPYNADIEDPANYVREYCDELGVGPQFVESAVSLVEDAKGEGLHVGKSPSGFAAGVVYATSKLLGLTDGDGDRVRQDDVAEIAGVSPVTIRRWYRDVLAIRAEDAGFYEMGEGAIDRAVREIYGDLADVPSIVLADAVDMAREIDTDADWVKRKSPVGIAAALLWVAADSNRVRLSQGEVADAAGIHKETVHKRVGDIRDHVVG